MEKQAENYAHSENKGGSWEPLRVHLKAVAERAAEFARAFGGEREAYAAGLLHDIAKYGDLFQRRLRGAESHLDHWSLGAWVAVDRYKSSGISTAVAIRGHHAGLGKANEGALRDLYRDVASGRDCERRRLSAKGADEVMRMLEADGLSAPEAGLVSTRYAGIGGAMPAAAMLDVRMLFSALVDADFIETEAHFAGDSEEARRYRREGTALSPWRDLEWLRAHIEKRAAESRASDAVKRMRADLLAACLEAGAQEQGLFTLTAPTGAGKTLSMLAFALKHAARHNLRRVIVVIPYLSIIEQTVSEYRQVYAQHMSAEDGAQYVLENHSLAGTREKGGEDGTERLLAENWDAPIVVTTSVQFLESLFANRPSSCRKLHRIAGSVVLFDEVQTLPVRLAVATLAGLSALSARYGTTVVFSTATQPAFSHLGDAVKALAGTGWKPREIAAPELKLFERARRTRAVWPKADTRLSWGMLAERLARDHAQALCVVNLKRHALTLTNLLRDRRAEGLFHLSTNMCPAHRRDVLAEVRSALDMGRPCRLISTQCVEAGVDVDFPVVYRALGPLESIAQAAGRCNRNGRMAAGDVHVFVPEDGGYPDGGYEQAADTLQILLRERAGTGLDIHDTALFERYYRLLYDFAKPALRAPGLVEAMKIQDFEKVAAEYRLISADAINVLVPYGKCVEQFKALGEEVRRERLSGGWQARARELSVSIFRPAADAFIWRNLERVMLRDGSMSEEWFIYCQPDDYDETVGLVVRESMGVLIG